MTVAHALWAGQRRTEAENTAVTGRAVRVAFALTQRGGALPIGTTKEGQTRLAAGPIVLTGDRCEAGSTDTGSATGAIIYISAGAIGTDT